MLIHFFAFIAGLFLLLAAWGILHQAILNARVKNTEAVSPLRYEGTLLANLVWVLIAISAPEINLPLLLGCGAMMIGSIVVLLQMFQYPPIRTGRVRSRIALVIFVSLTTTLWFATQKSTLFPYTQMLGVAGVVSSFFMIHLGTLDQLRLNKKRGSVEGLSLQKEVLHLLDWGTWIIYPVLLGFHDHWAPCINACFGFVFTILILLQFRRYR